MTMRRPLRITVILAGLALSVSCDETLHTGKVGNTRNPPSPDGTCPTGHTLCGQGAFAQCLDLANDREHCGSCNNACLPGIACQSAVCHQVACTGPVTVSTHKAPAGSSPSPNNGMLTDVNGDGRPDLVSWGMFDGRELVNAFQVALGKEGGGFGAPTAYQTARFPTSIVAGSFNDDAFQDLYVVGKNEPSCGVEIWLGHADGTMTLANRGTDIAQCWVATLADLNGDGRPDLVANIVNASGPTLFLADANGDYHVGVHAACSGLVWDWNGDSFPDLVNLFPTLGVCLNQGDGTFGDQTDCGVATTFGQRQPIEVIADFNRDGHPDLAMAVDNSVGVLLGMGGCQFRPMLEFPLTDLVQALEGGDVNGDGLVDLVAMTTDGSLSLLLDQPDATFQVVPFSVGGTVGFQSGGSVSVGDVNGDGKADVVFVPGRAPAQGVIGDDGSITTVPGEGNSTEIVTNTCP
jgi:hypothetical protein